jgi:hypothetical protein
MKITITTQKTIEVNRLLVQAGVRYWEDAEVNGVEDKEGDMIPCRNGDLWEPVIDLETGQITNWEKGKEADIHYKVCDNGEYWLLDKEGNKVVKETSQYVPDYLTIDDNGYGDYIIMQVDKNGFIQNWEFSLELFDIK